MKHIVVDDKTARAIAEAGEAIELRDQQGRHLGFLTRGVSEQDIEIARQRLASDAPRYTTQEVLDRLRSLESQ